MTPAVFTVTQALVDKMTAQARREAPAEACGMIGGSGLTATAVYPTRNVDAARVTYSIDPAEAFSVIRQMRTDGVDFIACYHSHPETEAYPSPTDRRQAGNTDLIYLILSLRRPEQPELRAFRIVDGEVDEISLSVSP
jgi:[CysO sulfur-carrier protein]-S-L-cysteine hydrolase